MKKILVMLFLLAGVSSLSAMVRAGVDIGPEAGYYDDGYYYNTWYGPGWYYGNYYSDYPSYYAWQRRYYNGAPYYWRYRHYDGGRYYGRHERRYYRRH